MNIVDVLSINFNFFEALNIMFILIVSSIYGFLLTFVYGRYFQKNEPSDLSIPKSFPIIAPSVATIFWLIQYSLPLSLGLLGALSFVRFRTPIKRAEDIGFILLLIAISLSCAVTKFFIGLGLIFIVYLIANLRNKNIFTNKNSFAILTLHTGNLNLDLNAKNINKNFLSLISTSQNDGTLSCVFQCINPEQNLDNIKKYFKKLDNECTIDIFYPNNDLGINY